MPAYRLYHLDGAGRVDTAEWVEAEDDVSATDVARNLLGRGLYAELWLGQRFVTRLDDKGAISGGAG